MARLASLSSGDERLDVTGIGDNQRTRFVQVCGDNAFRVVVAIFLADFLPRIWVGCEAPGLGKPGWTAEIAIDRETDPVGKVRRVRACGGAAACPSTR